MFKYVESLVHLICVWHANYLSKFQVNMIHKMKLEGKMCLVMQELWLLVSVVTGHTKEPSHRDGSFSIHNMCFG